VFGLRGQGAFRRFTFESERLKLWDMENKIRRFKHLSYEERIKIELLRKQGCSLRKMASVLNRASSSISDELNRKKVKGKYSAKKAQQKSYRARYWSKYQSFKALNYQFFIESKLKLRWSPEVISGELRKQGIIVSPKAIYKYVDSRCLSQYLWKPKTRKHPKPAYLKDYRKFIENKLIFSTGYYEMDFVVCSQNTKCLLVLVDRYSRLTMVLKLENRTKESIFSAFEQLKNKVKIIEIVTDNDIAFSCWRELEQRFKLKIFFTHPYRSWEKPLVEQTNKLIRQFIPKRTNLRLVSERKLLEIDRFINHKPRQCLNYLTSYEKHYQSQ